MISEPTVVGIDVGGVKKGFHAVALYDKSLLVRRFLDPEELATWCVELGAVVVAIDSPCKFSAEGRSRLAENQLAVHGQRIQSYRTPTEEVAARNRFYDWVLNGQRLYSALSSTYTLFNGSKLGQTTMLETFPNAVVCALVGRIVPAQPKRETRLKVLREFFDDLSSLQGQDDIDAALCALTARSVLRRTFHAFGDEREGFIVVPEIRGPC